jgi:hypothetical protein
LTALEASMTGKCKMVRLLLESRSTSALKLPSVMFSGFAECLPFCDTQVSSVYSTAAAIVVSLGMDLATLAKSTQVSIASRLRGISGDHAPDTFAGSHHVAVFACSFCVEFWGR